MEFKTGQIDDLITMYQSAKKHLENLEGYLRSLAEVRFDTLARVIDLLDLEELIP